MDTIRRERVREILRELGVDTSRAFKTTIVVTPATTQVTVCQWVKDVHGKAIPQGFGLRSETRRYTLQHVGD